MTAAEDSTGSRCRRTVVDFARERMKSYPVLDRLHIVDFKGIHDLAISPGRLTVLIGANGVGKTSVLEGVHLASLLLNEYLGGLSWTSALHAAPKMISDKKRLLAGRWKPEHLVRHGATALLIELEQISRTILIKIPGAGGWIPTLHVSVRASEEGQSVLQNQTNSTLRSLTEALWLRLDPERLVAPSTLQKPPGVHHDGAGLAAFLQYLHGRRDGTFEKIEMAMRTIVPAFRQLKFEPASWTTQETEFLAVEGQHVPRVVSREHTGVTLLVEFDDGAVVPAPHVSEGTLLALAILTAAQGGGRQHPKLLLIDDLERGLHPSAQHRLVEALKAILAATPDLQILATTHSPDLIDACDPGDVRVLGRGPEGVVARALTEHPEAAKWLKLLRVGEFWSTVGEDWVAGAPEPRT